MDEHTEVAALETFIPGLWSLSPLAGITGLLLFIAISLIRGWFIPRPSHERELAMANKRGDEWKETAKDLQDVNREIRRQNTELIEAVRTSSSFFEAMTRKGGDHHDST